MTISVAPFCYTGKQFLYVLLNQRQKLIKLEYVMIAKSQTTSAEVTLPPIYISHHLIVTWFQLHSGQSDKSEVYRTITVNDKSLDPFKF